MDEGTLPPIELESRLVFVIQADDNPALPYARPLLEISAFGKLHTLTYAFN
jgi:hypothetical protein